MPDRPHRKTHPHPSQAARQAEQDTFAVPTVKDEDRDLTVAARNGINYVELSVTSNFTFLTGASHPEELVQRAAELGHAAAAITDVNSLAGVVRAHIAAKTIGIPLVIGAQVRFDPALPQTSEQQRGGVAALHAETSSFVLSLYPTGLASYAPTLPPADAR